MRSPERSANTAATVPNWPSCQGVSSTPIVTGSVDWKTIAPATLPSAMRSLPSRVRMRRVAASGGSGARGAEEVEKVRRDEDPAEIRLDVVDLRGNERERECDGVHDKEEGEIPQGVRRVDVERVALAARSERERGDADEQHDERAEHERGAEDRAHPDLVRVWRVGEEDRDDRDERLRSSGPDRREDAPGGALADAELDAEPLDAVGEDLGADQDEDERADDQRDVDGAHPSSAPGSVGHAGGARDGAATTGANGAHEGDEDEDERTEHQEGGERAVEEVERAAVARDQRLAQLALRRVAEHERDDQRRQWVLQLPQPVANEAEDDRDEDVEHAVVQRVRPDDRDDDDERRDDRVWHAHDHREQRYREQTQDERHQMAQVDAGDEPPHEILVLNEEDGTGREAPDEKSGHHDR